MDKTICPECHGKLGPEAFEEFDRGQVKLKCPHCGAVGIGDSMTGAYINASCGSIDWQTACLCAEAALDEALERLTAALADAEGLRRRAEFWQSEHAQMQLQHGATRVALDEIAPSYAAATGRPLAVVLREIDKICGRWLKQVATGGATTEFRE